MKKKLLAVVIPSLFAASSTALASGFQLIEQSASGIGNAYAGSAAVADDAGTISVSLSSCSAQSMSMNRFRSWGLRK